jgi:hypothetical protein
MSTAHNELTLRLAAADPGSWVAVDDSARRQLWDQVIAEADPPARKRRRDRVWNWLRRRAIVVPVIAAIGGGAFGAQPAWCAICSHDRDQPALSSPSVTVSASAALGTADPTAPPADVGGQPHRATR